MCGQCNDKTGERIISIALESVNMTKWIRFFLFTSSLIFLHFLYNVNDLHGALVKMMNNQQRVYGTNPT